MSVYTKKELVKTLNDFYEDKDLLYVIYFTKDEFESRFDKEIKKKDWKYAIENIDSESQEQVIQEQIDENLMSEMELNEN